MNQKNPAAGQAARSARRSRTRSTGTRWSRRSTRRPRRSPRSSCRRRLSGYAADVTTYDYDPTKAKRCSRSPASVEPERSSSSTRPRSAGRTCRTRSGSSRRSRPTSRRPASRSSRRRSRGTRTTSRTSADRQGRHLPARLDRRLRRPVQLRRHVLRPGEAADWGFTNQALFERSRRPRQEEPDQAKRDADVQGRSTGRSWTSCPAVPFVAHPAVARVRKSTSTGFVPAPVSARTVRRWSTSPATVGHSGMLRFVVRRLLQLVPILFGLSILLFVWVRALPGGLHGPPGGAGDTRADRRDRSTLRPRPADLDAVLAYLDASSELDFGDSIQTDAAGHRGDGAPVPGHDRADPRRSDLRGRRSASRSGYFAARRHGTRLDSVSMIGLADRHHHPRVLPGVPAQVRVRGQAGLAADLGPAGPAHRRRPIPPASTCSTASSPATCDASWDAVQTPDPAGHRAGHDPARDHRADHPSRPCSTSSTRTTCAPPRPRASTAAAITPAARAAQRDAAGRHRRSACSSACCSPARSSPRPCSRSPASGSSSPTAIFKRDFPVLQGCILFLAVVYVLVNLRGRHLLRVVDPRVGCDDDR